MKIPRALGQLPQLEPLRNHAREAGLFLDLDGTLSPIIDVPEAVEVPRATREAVASLRRTWGDVVIISGRAASALVRILDLPDLTYVGNHGLEIIEQGERRILLPEDVVARMRSLGESLRSAIRCEGTFVELKELSHAIHYRRAPDPVAARECILRELKQVDLSGTRMTEGKMLLQLRPAIPLDKGSALELLVGERGLRWVLYAGDDTTDLDAFRSVASLRKEGRIQGYNVVVRHADTPEALLQQADLAVDGVEEMQRLLVWLAEAREG